MCGRVGRFAALEALGGISHVVTTREAFDEQLVRHDRQAAGSRIAAAMGCRGASWAVQVHGGRVVPVDAPGPAGEADALITRAESLAVMGVSADCPLILIAQAEGEAVGVVHASWRSTVAGIAARAVQRMGEDLDVDPASLVACICPSAGPCCYEVGPEVRAAATGALGPGAAEHFTAGIADRHMLDLWSANRAQLRSAGVEPRNIHVAGICTICGQGPFPSHRGDGPSTGRFAAAIVRIGASAGG
jgi:YfiH family protein